MNRTSKLSIETEDLFSSLLEFASNNDVDAFRRSIELDLSAVDEPGLWLVRRKGSKQITHEERTPLMVAATYGSLDVLRLIVALPEVDLNRTCGHDKWTPLHCASSGGSVDAFAAIKLLLSAGADPNIEDTSGRRPIDVIVAHPKLPVNKSSLEDLLTNNTGVFTSNASSPVLSSCPESMSPRSPSEYSKKQYPIDPSLPDIRNSIYSSDEFRMFSFKVRPCSRAYSHDWTECPFVHPGENARRRDPRKYHYSCVPCPEFRKGACRRGDMCEYAHGVFECWLHPAQYRTRLCKDGSGCGRQVCFFAHAHDELRPMYVSTGSGIPSPRSPASFMDMASLSPNGPMCWPQPNVPPALHLPGSNIQSSRLRSSLNARDIPPEDFNLLRDFDAYLMPNSPMLGRSNLDELFTADTISSPRFSSPTHKSAVINQFHHQNILSPINTNGFSSPRNVEHPFLQMSPRSLEAGSPLSARHPVLAQRERLQQQQMHSLGNSPTGWAKWGPPTIGNADWSVGGDDQACLRRSVEFKDEGDEPDLSWVQSLVKESSPPEMIGNKPGAESSGECVKSDSQIYSTDHTVLGSWLEQMQLDQLVVQRT
ncbi:hypothetical protein CASFOL_031281 [Castilleja foliolosa]|uniref:C3H1-type domain-containing protein n=1 Tax=Castilleja foliolosa TaxID=1961234 RepID=A0ABD3C4A3_9LAMI